MRKVEGPPAFLACGVIAAGLLAPPASAAPPAPLPRELSRTDPGSLGLESAVALTLLLSSRVLLDSPTWCVLCERNDFDLAARDALRLDDPSALPALSHVMSLGILPLGGFVTLMVPAANAGRWSHAGEDAWLLLNGFLLTSALTDSTKKLLARERPAFWAGDGAETEFSDTPSARYRSFFSGDTAWAFNFAATTATLAYMRGHSTAPYVTAGGAALATTVAYIRVAADLHWTTDVLTGAAVGTGVGVLVPLLLHARADRRTPVSLVPFPVSGATGLAVRWVR